MWYDREYADSIRAKYPIGTRIVLDHMGDDPHPIEPGTKGIVSHVDDMGTVFCEFDNGRYLGLIPGEDVFHVIREMDRGDER